ncbi:hypothetical protein N9140_00300 [bacterium]|nr:hypothetical protein [bacterium]
MVGHEKQEHMPELKVIGRGMNEMFKSKIGELEETMQSKLGGMKGNMEEMKGSMEELSVNIEGRVASMESDLKEIKDLLAQLVGKNGETKTEE